MTLKAVMVAESVATVAASTGVDLQAAGFEFGAGRTAVLIVTEEINTADQVGDLQESDVLASGYADVANGEYAAADGTKVFVVPLNKRYVRINNSAGTTGATNFMLLQ